MNDRPMSFLHRFLPALLLSTTPVVAASFGTPQVILENVSPEAWIHAADIDRDGDGDVLFSPAPGVLDLLRQQSNGSYSPLRLIDGGGVTRVLGAAVLDADGDGRMDVAAYVQHSSAGQTSTGVRLMRQGIWGLFPSGNAVDLIAGAHPAPQAPLQVADLDRDGRPDLVMAWKTSLTGTAKGRVSWFRNTGGGNFSGANGLLFQTFDAPCALTTEDLNRDGYPDLAVADNGKQKVLIYAGPGFSAGQTLSLAGAPRHIAVVDQNGDGWPDLFTAMGALNTPVQTVFRYYYGAAPGWTEGNIVHTTNQSGNTAMAVADLNLDGTQDIILAHEQAGNQRALALLARPSGLPDIQLTDVMLDPVGAAAVHDEDGDGDHDLFFCTAQSVVKVPNITPHRKLFPATMGKSSNPGNAPSGAACFATGDFNRDGRMDMASASAGDGKIRAYLHGTSSVLNTTSVADNAGCRWIAAADLDRDGDTDLVAPSLTQNRVAWYRSNGSGGWNTQLIAAPVALPICIAAGDVDGDGWADLATYSITDQKVYLLTNSPDAESWTSSVPASLTDVIRLEIADLIPGGRKEILAQHGNGAKVSLIRYSGGSWAVSTIFPAIPANLGGEGLAVADLDGNGLDDIAVGAGQVCYSIHQTAPGTFSSQKVIGIGGVVFDVWEGPIRSVRTADMDLDGLPECVAVYDEGIIVHHLPRPGIRPARDAVVLLENASKPPGDVALAYLDGDAVPDVIHPDASGSRICFSHFPTAPLGLEALPACAISAGKPYPVQSNISVPLLRLKAAHYGWGHDAPISLSQLALRCRKDDPQQTPLTHGQIIAGLPSLELYSDAGMLGTLETGVDGLAAYLTPLATDAAGWSALALTSKMMIEAGKARHFVIGGDLGMGSFSSLRLEIANPPAATSHAAAAPSAGVGLEKAVGVFSTGEPARFAYGPLSLRQQWRLSHFHRVGDIFEAANSADPDGDGYNNLLEYALRLNPKVVDPPGHLKVEFSQSSIFLRFIAANQQPDTELILKGSVNLKDWSPRAERLHSGHWDAPGGLATSIPVDENVSDIVYSKLFHPGGAEYFRLEARELAP